MTGRPVRTLRLVLGDQLDPDLSALADVDAGVDAVWMAENDHEIRRVPTHRLRIAVFLSAMRHRRDAMRAEGLTVEYHGLAADPAEDRGSRFSDILAADLARLEPERVVLTRPGDFGVLDEIRRTVEAAGVEFELREDDRFLCALDDFRGWVEGRKRWVLEDFYRWMRKRTGVLMDAGEPVGGEWNFDAANREAFGSDGPGDLPPRPSWPLDDVDRSVLELVAARYSDHPGRAERLSAWPRTPDHARELLTFFIDQLLPGFGDTQDAMWSDEVFLRHSGLALPLNTGLIRPAVCVRAAVDAHAADAAPLNSVEGFVRQILGWREYVRGVYWVFMPEYAERNELAADRDVPEFYWDGDTSMECVRRAMGGVLEYGYAHHIQRLMVLGLYALLFGVHPRRFHEWHLAMYVDAVDWVSLPNALGMSQFGDGGVTGTKPYCASGNYIDRMSNHCADCRFDPGTAVGDDACPFTTLYWDFLARHEEELRGNRRMGFQYANLDRKREAGGLREIRDRAAELRSPATS